MRINLVARLVPKGPARDFVQASVSPEVRKALVAWSKAVPATAYVLIGGLALAFYVRPRYTEGVDVLLLSDADIPDQVTGFKHNRAHAFEHKKTGVEVEVVTPNNTKLDTTVIRRVFDCAVEHDGVKVASLAAMIVLKLIAGQNPKRRRKDHHDILSMLMEDVSIEESIVDGWDLTNELKTEFVKLYLEARS